VFTHSNPDNSGIAEEEYRFKSTAGVAYYGNSDASDTLTRQLVPYDEGRFPVKIGSSFVQINRTGLDYGEDLDGDGVNERVDVYSQVTVVGFESVTVDAGTFHNCVKLQTTLYATVSLSGYPIQVTVTNTLTEWYAPDVGPVKDHSVTSIPFIGWWSTQEARLLSYNVQ
jgi:hypothetical protein